MNVRKLLINALFVVVVASCATLAACGSGKKSECEACSSNSDCENDNCASFSTSNGDKFLLCHSSSGTCNVTK